MNGKLNSVRIISETNADMYMNVSIFYDICKYCDYIISWNTVSCILLSFLFILLCIMDFYIPYCISCFSSNFRYNKLDFYN